MSQTAETQYFDRKIARLDTKGKILSVADMDCRLFFVEPGEDKAPKFQFDYCAYDLETNKAKAVHRHWVDADVLLLLAWDLLTMRKGDKTEGGFAPILDEFKGGRAGKTRLEGVTEDMILSRRFTVNYTEALTKIGPCYQFRFEVKDGRKGDKGQVMPVAGSKAYLKEDMNVTVPQARRFGLWVYNYILAKTSGVVGTFPTVPAA